ncbi:MAG: hypothetical protein KDD67_18580 [Ignavibacteriae bacterium]|nr:hypothetical protein [Ignavibacteriota bacterium]MCB9214477.1 hypothetical protein [Ignavibacteria bacterium]
MIRKTLLLLVPVIIATAMVGCGDDNPTVSVNPVLKFTSGDKFTYNYYERDENDARVESSKQVVVWTVLRSGLDTLSENGVVEIQEVRFEADGTTEKSRSKIYFAIDQGELSQYNLFQTVLERFSGQVDLSSYIGDLPNTWVKVNSTKDASARVLQSNSNIVSQTLKDVMVLTLVFDAKLKLGINSQHLGKVEVTAPTKTYSAAYATDNWVNVNATNPEEISVPPITIPANSNIINDSVLIHYDVDITDGILRQTMGSKTVMVAGTVSQPINGYEMELTAVERVSAE